MRLKRTYLLFCKPLKTHTKGEDIFLLIQSFFEEHNISWKNSSSVCTDGAAAMIGEYSGAAARTKSKNSETVALHCFLHRHALAVKRMPPDLVDVLEDVTKIVNFIKTRPLSSRIFKVLYGNIGKTHKVLLLYTVFKIERRCWQDFMSYMQRFTAFYLFKSTSLLLN